MSMENIIELSFKHEQVWVLSVMLNELKYVTTRGCCLTRWTLEPQAATSPVWRPQLQVWVGILTDVNSCAWLVGLGVWFSLRVREVPGSNPGRALLLTSEGLTHLINLILKTRGETRSFRWCLSSCDKAAHPWVKQFWYMQTGKDWSHLRSSDTQINPGLYIELSVKSVIKIFISSCQDRRKHLVTLTTSQPMWQQSHWWFCSNRREAED